MEEKPQLKEIKSEIEELIHLIEQGKIDEAANKVKERLNKNWENEDYDEILINNLSNLSSKSVDFIKEIFPSLLKLIRINADVLRYSLILSLKPIVETYPDLLVGYAKEYLEDKSPNARESILQLLEFAASKNPESIKPFISIVIKLLADEKDFVQKKAIDLLKVEGKKFEDEIEKSSIEFLKTVQNEEVKKNVEELLKKLIDIKKLEQENVTMIEIETAKKILDEKEKEIAQVELKIKEEAIKKKEELISLQKESTDKDKELIQKELELKEKEQLLKEKELKLKEAALAVKEKEIEHAEIELVKKELEIKNLDEKKEEIIKNEEKRINKATKDDDHE